MKRQLAGWVAPFSFNEKQRNTLEASFSKIYQHGKKRELVDSYIATCEDKLKLWVSLDKKLLITPDKQKRDQLTKLKSKASAFKAALDGISDDTGNNLFAYIVEQFLSDQNATQKYDAKMLLTLFDNDGLEVLLLKLIAAIDQSIKEKNVKPNLSNDREIELLANLAERYQQAFGKNPSASRNTNFYNFCKALADVTGYSFGDKTITDSIKLYKK